MPLHLYCLPLLCGQRCLHLELILIEAIPAIPVQLICSTRIQSRVLMQGARPAVMQVKLHCDAEVAMLVEGRARSKGGVFERPGPASSAADISASKVGSS